MQTFNKFSLSPVFCLHNGVVVLNQDEDAVTIGLLDLSNIILRCRLAHAVSAQVRNNGKPVAALFQLISQDEFNRHISVMFSKKRMVFRHQSID